MTTATQSPPGAPAARRMTREDIVRAGRGASPWEFIPLALAALRVVPQDAEIRFLLSAAYAKLGLRTPAMEHLALLPPELAADPNVTALRAAEQALPDDRLSFDALLHTLRANLAALRERSVEPVDALSYLPTWTSWASARQWFRTCTGDIVWRNTTQPDSWERFEPQRDLAAGLRLEHDPSPTAPVYPPSYFIEGIDPPWVFERICSSTPPRADGHASFVLLVQHDPIQFLCGLAQLDLTQYLRHDRVRIFIGPDAAARLQQFVASRVTAGIRIAGPALALPTTHDHIRPELSAIVSGALDAARQANALATERVAAAFPPHDRSFWADRYHTALNGGAPLRILIATSRYSTFLRHSGADLADAFAHIGCTVRVHMEPDSHALHESLADMRAVLDLTPDLIIVPNYLRANLGTSYPADVPFLTWVQDSMPHLFEPAAGAKLTDRDFIAGNLREEMFQSFGYPRARAMHAPMAASTRKFHPAPVADDLRRRHECDIAYVSHHSQTPEALHQRRVAESSAVPRASELLTAIFPRILEIIRSPITRGPLSPLLRVLTREELRRVGLPDSEPALASVLTSYVHPIADRALRHHILDSAARLAEKRGWRMHLYGKGWETHPTLSHFARGELNHGEDLRACYQSARAHLHLSLHTAIHQRVFECAFSGGLPLCRLQADDLSQLEYLAAATACRTREPDTIDPTRRTSDGYAYGGYAIDSCEPTRRYRDLLNAWQLPAPSHLWLNQIHAERLRSSPDQRIDGEGQSLTDLWPDPAALMFHDDSSFERLLTRAVEDRDWRDAQSRALADHARPLVSYDALARSMLSFIARCLSDSPATTARWYDGRSTPSSRRPTP